MLTITREKNPSDEPFLQLFFPMVCRVKLFFYYSSTIIKYVLSLKAELTEKIKISFHRNFAEPSRTGQHILKALRMAHLMEILLTFYTNFLRKIGFIVWIFGCKNFYFIKMQVMICIECRVDKFRSPISKLKCTFMFF